VADQGNQQFGSILVPLLDTESKEREDHRTANQMPVKITPERDEARNIKKELVGLIHDVVPSPWKDANKGSSESCRRELLNRMAVTDIPGDVVGLLV
jgi:hypothetical protein